MEGERAAAIVTAGETPPASAEKGAVGDVGVEAAALEAGAASVNGLGAVGDVEVEAATVEAGAGSVNAPPDSALLAYGGGCCMGLAGLQYDAVGVFEGRRKFEAGGQSSTSQAKGAAKFRCAELAPLSGVLDRTEVGASRGHVPGKL